MIRWLEEVRIRHYYFRSRIPLRYDRLQLLVLVDANQDAYGAVTYIHIKTAIGPLVFACDREVEGSIVTAHVNTTSVAANCSARSEVG